MPIQYRNSQLQNNHNFAEAYKYILVIYTDVNK